MEKKLYQNNNFRSSFIFGNNSNNILWREYRVTRGTGNRINKHTKTKEIIRNTD